MIRSPVPFASDAPGRQQTNVLLPATLLGARDRVEVHIAVDRPFVPANLIADSQDTRELGIQVYRATVERSAERRSLDRATTRQFGTAGRQRDGPELEDDGIAPSTSQANRRNTWRGDETYVRVKGRWCYLYRATSIPAALSDRLRALEVAPMPLRPHACSAPVSTARQLRG